MKEYYDYRRQYPQALYGQLPMKFIKHKKYYLIQEGKERSLVMETHIENKERTVLLLNNDIVLEYLVNKGEIYYE